MYKTFKDFIAEKETPPHYNEGIFGALQRVPGGIGNIVGTLGKDTIATAKTAATNVANTGTYVKQAYAKGTEKQGVAQIKADINDIITNPSFKFLRPDAQRSLTQLQKYFKTNHLKGQELKYNPVKQN